MSLKWTRGRARQAMTLQMEAAEGITLGAMREFLAGSRELECSMPGRWARYRFVEGVLRAQGYDGLAKPERGLVRRYLAKLTGLSRAQLGRLIGRWKACRELRPKAVERPVFARRYTVADVALLAAVDAAHEGLSGPATKRILERECAVYGQAEYARLARISVAHLYNLRQREEYRRRRGAPEHTVAVARRWGERRRPEPLGRPGYLRVDTVHQGAGGPYHL